MAAGSERLPPVSKESYEGWWHFAYQHGTTVAGLCEAIGLTLRDYRGLPIDALSPQLRRTTLAAADIAKERASRKKS